MASPLDNALETTSYLLPLISKASLTYFVWKTFANTNSHLFALLCHFGLQYSRDLKLEFCNSDESVNSKLPTFGDFYSEIKSWCLQSNTLDPSKIHICSLWMKPQSTTIWDFALLIILLFTRKIFWFISIVYFPKRNFCHRSVLKLCSNLVQNW
jgi:hypothetical protein